MAKQQSLQSTAVTPASPPPFRMPAIFGGPSPAIQARAWAPYVTFAHAKRADEWKKLVAKFKTVDEGDMYFIHGDRLEQLTTAKMTLIAATQYWASKSQAGVLLASSFKEMPDPFKEYVEAVVLVYFPDAVFPANVQFRTTKCPAAKVMADALELAGTPAWADESPAHKETLVLADPWARFYAEVSLAPARPSKTSGLPYKPSQATVFPTGIPEWRQLKAFQDAEDTSKLLDMVARRYESNLAEVRQKEVKAA